jgi:uncharacterized protein YkwD
MRRGTGGACGRSTAPGAPERRESAPAAAARHAGLLAPLAPLALLLAACGMPLGGLPVEPPPRPAPADPAVASAVAAAVVDEANRVRVQHGTGLRHPDAALQRSAQDYANELATRRVLEHESATPGRRTLGERVDAAGVRWTAVAENLGMLTGPAPTMARRVVQMWLDSPGHRHNLLNEQWTLSGAGVGLDDRGFYYVVQVYVVTQAGGRR